MLAATAALTLGVTGCSSTDSDGRSADGPLVASDDVGGTWCLPRFEADGNVTHGSEVVHNDSDEPVSIDSVSLMDSSGFELDGAYLSTVPRSRVGVLIGWPRGKAKVAVPLTTVGGDQFGNVIFHLHSVDDVTDASIAGVRINYSQNGDRYYVDTPDVVQWQKRCDSGA